MTPEHEEKIRMFGARYGAKGPVNRQGEKITPEEATKAFKDAYVEIGNYIVNRKAEQ